MRLSGSSEQATTKAPPNLVATTPTRACDDKRLASLQPVDTRQDVDGVGAEDDEHDHVHLQVVQAVDFDPTFLHARLGHYARHGAAHHHHKTLIHTLRWQGLNRVAAACLVKHSQFEVAGQAQQATEQLGHHHTYRVARRS